MVSERNHLSKIEPRQKTRDVGLPGENPSGCSSSRKLQERSLGPVNHVNDIKSFRLPQSRLSSRWSEEPKISQEDRCQEHGLHLLQHAVQRWESKHELSPPAVLQRWQPFKPIESERSSCRNREGFSRKINLLEEIGEQPISKYLMAWYCEKEECTCVGEWQSQWTCVEWLYQDYKEIKQKWNSSNFDIYRSTSQNLFQIEWNTLEELNQVTRT